MALDQFLQELLERWAQVSHAEAAAIAADQWDQVARCHAAKAVLQTQIDCRLPLSAAEQRAAAPLVEQLLQLEDSNRASVAARRARAAEAQAECQQATRKLHNLRCAYRPSNFVRWQSYS